jgi:hypothetical protein
MVKVLYVVGSSRCGSTVLANIFGELDGVFSAGEIRYVWDRVLQGRRCGCGLQVDRCDVWRSVLPAAGRDRREIVALAAAQQRTLRLHHTPILLRRSPRRLLRSRELARYVAAMTALYEGLSSRTGARVIVDSSKRPSNAAALRLIGGIEPYVLHLVRDPRGVAYSRLRPKANPDGAGEMPKVSAPFSVVDWTATNIAAEDVRRHLGPGRSLFLRYEEFVTAPRQAIEAIGALLGERMDSDPFVDNSTVALGPNHTVSGNPGRFDRGVVKLRPDMEWVHRMRPRDRRITTSLALPLLVKYGYPILSNRRASISATPPAIPEARADREPGAKADR